MPKSLDERTIEALVAHGADLATPRKTNHYFYARRQRSAEALAARLQKEGRNIDVHQTEDEWVVVVKFVMIVGPSSMADARREFESAAAAAGAHYEGWEASVR